MADLINHTAKKRFVKELTKRATPAEKRLRSLLIQHNIKYVFQKPFTNKIMVHKGGRTKPQRDKLYIADFYLPKYATVIELDGGVHNTLNANIRDGKRTTDIVQGNKMVHTVLRFSNKQVLEDGLSVITLILSLRYVRFVNKDEKRKNKAHNSKIQKQNEVTWLIYSDPDLPEYQKNKLLKQL